MQHPHPCQFNMMKLLKHNEDTSQIEMLQYDLVWMKVIRYVTVGMRVQLNMTQ